MEFEQPDATDRPTNKKKQRSAENVSTLKWYIYIYFLFSQALVLWLIKLVNAYWEPLVDDYEKSNNLL